MVSLPKEKRSRRNTKIDFKIDDATARDWCEALISIALCPNTATVDYLRDIACEALKWTEEQ